MGGMANPSGVPVENVKAPWIFVGIQEMLLAPEPGAHGKLNLFPAWPAVWDVDFKLHAPGPTIVEGVLRGGKLKSLKVTPETRAKDIVNWLNHAPEAMTPGLIK